MLLALHTQDRLPPDVVSLRVAPPEWFAAEGFRWLDDPSELDGYLGKGVPEASRAAYERMFADILWVGVDEEDNCFGLWRHHAELTWERAPIVGLDNEGTFTSHHRNVTSYLLEYARDREYEGLLEQIMAWMESTGVSAPLEDDEMWDIGELLPNAQDRFDAMHDGRVVRPTRLEPARIERLEQVLGSIGDRESVRTFLAEQQTPGTSFGLDCDGWGRIRTIVVPSGQWVARFGVQPGSTREQVMTRLGQPERRYESALRYLSGSDVAIQYEFDRERLESVYLLWLPGMQES